jgi:hypothetical protein
MLILLLQSVQHATQATRDTTAVLPQPQNVPEWVKTLITALVGAVVGFVSSVILEFLKPFIAKRLLRRSVRTHLVNELRRNTEILELAFKLMTNARSQDEESHRQALRVALRFIPLVSSDRYTHYFTQAKDLVYDLDRGHSLALFYRILTEYFPPEKLPLTYTFGEVNTGLYSALAHAREYLNVSGPYPIPSHMPELELAYLDVPDSDDPGMSVKIDGPQSSGLG